MNQYAVGNQIACRFAFTTRALTPAELAYYLAGEGLPAGVGVDQDTVMMDWKVNDGDVTTLSGADITHDSTGAYHGVITVAEEGSYEYRGYSLDVDSDPLASTAKQVFVGVPF